MQELQKTFYDSFGADTEYLLEVDRPHTTGFLDAKMSYTHWYPNIPGSGISTANDVNMPEYGDLTFQTES
jgi:hypothetical protein